MYYFMKHGYKFQFISENKIYFHYAYWEEMKIEIPSILINFHVFFVLLDSTTRHCLRDFKVVLDRKPYESFGVITSSE